MFYGFKICSNKSRTIKKFTGVVVTLSVSFPRFEGDARDTRQARDASEARDAREAGEARDHPKSQELERAQNFRASGFIGRRVSGEGQALAQEYFIFVLRIN